MTDLKEWEDYKKKIAKGEKATMPKGISRRPVRKGLKEPIILCMCSTSSCLGKFNQSKQSCPIQCIKKEAECSPHGKELCGVEYYDHTAPPGRKCSCPVCNCPCIFVCYVKDIESIIRLRESENTTTDGTNDVSDIFNSEMTTPSFLRNIMGDAMKVVSSHLPIMRRNEWKRKEFLRREKT